MSSNLSPKDEMIAAISSLDVHRLTPDQVAALRSMMIIVIQGLVDEMNSKPLRRCVSGLKALEDISKIMATSGITEDHIAKSWFR